MVRPLYIHEFEINYLGQSYKLGLVDAKYNERDIFSKFNLLFMKFYDISLMNDNLQLVRSTTSLNYFITHRKKEIPHAHQ